MNIKEIIESKEREEMRVKGMCIFYTESKPELEFDRCHSHFSFFNGVLTIDASHTLSESDKKDYDNYRRVSLNPEINKEDIPTERWKYLCDNTKVIIMRGNITDIPYPFFTHFVLLHTIVFPEALQRIGYLNFEDCPNLKFLHLPKNIKDVSGLKDKNNLLYIDVSDENELFATENGYLMSKDKKTLIAVPGGLDVVYVPDGCKVVGPEAFYNSHTKIIVPSSVAQIDIWNFHYSDSIREIELGDYAKQYPLIKDCYTSDDYVSKKEYEERFKRIRFIKH